MSALREDHPSISTSGQRNAWSINKRQNSITEDIMSAWLNIFPFVIIDGIIEELSLGNKSSLFVDHSLSDGYCVGVVIERGWFGLNTQHEGGQ